LETVLPASDDATAHDAAQTWHCIKQSCW